MRVEYEQICASDSGYIRRAAASAQHGDLTEEMTDAETKPLLLQIDLDLAGRDEIHGMRRLCAASNYSTDSIVCERKSAMMSAISPALRPMNSGTRKLHRIVRLIPLLRLGHHIASSGATLTKRMMMHRLRAWY